jgi:hypothetical protein
MSRRKNKTGIIGCSGWVSGSPFYGDWVTKHCSECSFSLIGRHSLCQEFRQSVKFKRIRKTD